MQRICLALVVFAICLGPQQVIADSYFEFQNFRQVDATGRFYIVVKKGAGGPSDPGRGTPVNVEIVERRPDSPAVVEAKDFWSFESGVQPNPEVKVRDGDIIRGRCQLVRCPRSIVLSSTGQGFVGLDVRGYNYGDRRSGDAVVIVGGDGSIRHRKHLIDILSENTITRFDGTAGGIFWAGGGWINETRKQIVIYTLRVNWDRNQGERLFRIVDLQSGAVREASDAEIITALVERNPGALESALILAADSEMKAAVPHMVKLFGDENLPMKARLQAAVALGHFGDDRGAEMLTKATLHNDGNQKYAVEHLAEVLGDRAATILCDALARYGDSIREQASEAMSQVSDPVAVPQLITLLNEKSSETTVRFAIGQLGSRGPGAKSAVPSLIRVLEAAPQGKGSYTTHHCAANALEYIGPDAKAALPRLQALADIHARLETERAKTAPPEDKRAFVPRRRSDADFVEAILKIKGE